MDVLNIGEIKKTLYTFKMVQKEIYFPTVANSKLILISLF